MGTQRKYHIALASLLACLMLSVYIAKPVHMVHQGCFEAHHNANETATHLPSAHDCTTCAICQFVLTDFPEAASCNMELFLPVLLSETDMPYSESLYVRLVAHNHYRGPPSSYTYQL